MMKLRRAQDILVPHLEVAKSFWTRSKGLIGRKSLPDGQGLWIWRCNSIHTCGMNFPIDLIFVDKKLVVRKTMSRVQPWRLVLPVWRASSVFELPPGFLDKHPVTAGEQLHVDHTLS
jgi:uncharacterized membrane protein (UPF0127 family)